MSLNLIFDSSRDLVQNEAHCPNFAAIGIADADQISPDLGPEAS